MNSPTTLTFTVEHGLWTAGAAVAPPPLAAVVEVSGAVLEWTVDEPVTSPRVTVTDVDAADWLWRLIGPEAHVRLAAADSTAAVEAPLDDAAISPLRRLGLGHWMRRWWPASARDGIVALDGAVLDAELAVVTASVEEFLGEEGLDADLTSLLRGAATATADVRDDPRVAELIDACAELGDLPDTITTRARRRADYTLIAGDATGHDGRAIAAGVASISWTAVPAGVFDAAEDTVAWSVATEGPTGPIVARVRAALAEPAAGHPLSAGVAVRLSSGEVTARGELSAEGEARLPVDLDEAAAWNHDWSSTAVMLGAGSGEARATRERARRFVRSRLAAPPADAFVAEVLAAESDY